MSYLNRGFNCSRRRRNNQHQSVLLTIINNLSRGAKPIASVRAPATTICNTNRTLPQRPIGPQPGHLDVCLHAMRRQRYRLNILNRVASTSVTRDDVVGVVNVIIGIEVRIARSLCHARKAMLCANVPVALSPCTIQFYYDWRKLPTDQSRDAPSGLRQRARHQRRQSNRLAVYYGVQSVACLT